MSIPELTNALETAVADEDTEATATAVKAITDQQATPGVIAELGNRLTKNGATVPQQTVTAYALTAVNHVEAVHHLGKFLADNKRPIAVRTTLLGLLQQQFLHFPAETLTYLRQTVDKAEPAFKERLQATFEFAIGQTISHETIPPANILTQAGVQPKHLKESLLKKVGNLDGAAIPVPSIFAEALGYLQQKESVDLLCQLLRMYENAQLQEEQEAQAGNGNSANDNPNLGQIRERVMLAAVNGLRMTHSENGVNCLANTLTNNLNYKVQRQAADALGKLGFESCIPFLFTALFTESNQSLKKKIGDSLQEIEGWQKKAIQLIQHLNGHPVQRDQIEAEVVITAVQPEQSELTKNPHLLTNFLIHAAVQQHSDERLLQIFAELIKAATKNNRNVINEQLELYRENEKVSEDILQALRVEIGGAQTLKPILNKLEQNLLDYFQKPIDSLNTDTQTIWKRTIVLANLGFFVRIFLNLAIFAIGAYFMVDSYNKIVAGNLQAEQITALMVVFIGGGATMFGTFFTLPLKQIKRAVTDVGLANVAFISYVHQVLQISHTFSYFYLNGDISFEEIKGAAKQIEDISHGAILTLNMAGSDSDPAQFDSALLERIKADATNAPANPSPPAENNAA